MEIIGWVLAVLIGMLLGLIGGGGSILTVPVLVYIVGIDSITSITYSLFIVGITAFIGAIISFRKNNLNVNATITFALPSFISVFITRKLLLPLIPETFMRLGNFEVSKGLLLLLTFAILMLFSAVSMISQTPYFKNPGKHREENHLYYAYIFIEGIIVGLLTGFVGAGGGFLIIPALVLFVGLPMKHAVGTSLFIIAVNSLIGFATDLFTGKAIDWWFLFSFSAFAVAGIIGGTILSKKIDGSRLRPAFGWFILFTGTFIIIKEIIAGI